MKIGIILVILMLAGCQSPKEPSTAPGDGAVSWPGNMQALSSAISALIPKVGDASYFRDPANRPELEIKMTQLKKFAHEVAEGKGAPDQDPSMSMIANRFESDIDASIEALKLGHTEYSRGLIRSSLSYCVQCHTRMSSGPRFSKLDISDAIKQLRPVDQIQFLIATRQFDEASGQVKKMLSAEDSAKINIFEWEKLVHLSLVVSVRFNDDPKSVEDLIQIVEQSKSSPYFLRRDISFWKKSVADWKNEKSAKSATIGARLAQAKKLIVRGDGYQNESMGDGGAIEYLRATSLLHEALGAGAKGLEKSEALYNIGLTSETVREINSWSSNEDYYELCIRNLPHTDIAKKCFIKYEHSIFVGFSGSSGLVIPKDVRIKLEYLRSLSM